MKYKYNKKHKEIIKNNAKNKAKIARRQNKNNLNE